MLASILGLGPHTTITIPVPAPLRTPHTVTTIYLRALRGNSPQSAPLKLNLAKLFEVYKETFWKIDLI